MENAGIITPMVQGSPPPRGGTIWGNLLTAVTYPVHPPTQGDDSGLINPPPSGGEKDLRLRQRVAGQIPVRIVLVAANRREVPLLIRIPRQWLA